MRRGVEPPFPSQVPPLPAQSTPGEYRRFGMKIGKTRPNNSRDAGRMPAYPAQRDRSPGTAGFQPALGHSTGFHSGPVSARSPLAGSAGGSIWKWCGSPAGSRGSADWQSAVSRAGSPPATLAKPAIRVGAPPPTPVSGHSLSVHPHTMSSSPCHDMG
jgi:hypothetical protein